jgi:hypothetical protein
MDIAYISALSALGGSVIGGLTSGVTSWLGVKSQVTAGERAHDRGRREELYKDFIVAASRAYGNALVGNDPPVQEVVELHAMTSRMRVVSSPKIIECAERIVRLTVDTYFEPNKTMRQMHDMMKAGTAIDPLREFSETAREELLG